MTAVRIAHAEPRPGWQRDGELAISQILVVLADDAGRRALPVWLTAPDGDSLWRLLDQQAGPAGMGGVEEETADRLLRAVGVTVTGVDLDELDSEVTRPLSAPPPPSTAPPVVPPTVAPPTVARISLAGPSGTAHMTARLGYGLALAAAAGAPVRVAGPVMDRLAVPAGGGDLLGPFLDREPATARPAASSRRPRFEPRNLAFADGLDGWELRGPGSHRPDYSPAAEGQRAVLSSAVPEPSGEAGLIQSIFADDYRGAAVVFRAELRTEDVADRAGLYLHTGPPPRRATDTVAGSHGWTRHEVMVEIPGNAGMIRFGIFLSGRGRVEMRHAELTREQVPDVPGAGNPGTASGH